MKIPNYLYKVKKDPIGIHFSAPNHRGTKDIEIHVLAFITIPPKSKHGLNFRLQIEKNWIHKMRCPAPRGLNIFD